MKQYISASEKENQFQCHIKHAHQTLQLDVNDKFCRKTCDYKIDNLEETQVTDMHTDPTSYKVKSLPPVIFHTIPVALSMPISSNGDWMEFSAASLALDLPAKLYQNGQSKSSNRMCETVMFCSSNI